MTKQLAGAQYGRVGDFNARIEENVGGMRVVQAFANEDHERGCSPSTTPAIATTKLTGLPA
jgi:ATP-binding cassette subfamily B protein